MTDHIDVISDKIPDQKSLIFMRGLPWVGKSYYAKKLLENSEFTGIICSTDEYWYRVNFPDKPEEYSFNRNLLGAAHKWNQLRAHRAIDVGTPLIIIDNTNVTADDCYPYSDYAIPQGYEVIIEEPTSERWVEIKKVLLEKKRDRKLIQKWAATLSEGSKETHNVPQWSIEKMMWRWQNFTPQALYEHCEKQMSI